MRHVGSPLAALPLAVAMLVAGLALAPPPVSAGAPASASVAAALVTDPAALVEPRVGTTGGAYYGGHTSPAATVPFGMVQFGPDTTSRPPGGGYLYEDTAITGFSATHLSGPGCAAYGDVPLLPTTGPIGSDPNALGAASLPFTHASEVVAPGAYQVDLGAGAGSVRAELAATARAGIGRFTFPATAAANVLVKAGGSAAGNDRAAAIVLGNNTIVTSSRSGHFCGTATTYDVYTTIQFSRPFAAVGTWTPAGVVPGGKIVNHPKAGVYATFDASTDPVVTARIGVSFVSISGAASNLAAELTSFDPAPVRTAARQAWNDVLGTIQVGGGTLDQQRTFYTALYHSFLHPNVFSDIDGSYPGFDGQVHTAGPGGHYANFSGWDVYRTQIPLLAWLLPDRASAIVRSLLDDAAQNGGRLPKWSLANAETYVMVGDPAAPAIAGAAAFGATDFDVTTALARLVQQATIASDVRPGLDRYRSLGYLPTDGTYGCCLFSGPVSTTLEYATADFAISRLAAANGDAGTAATFLARSAAWKHLFQARDGLFQQKVTSSAGAGPAGWAGGRFLAGPNPTTQYGFVEGDALQYAWAVPQDLGGLVAAVGGGSVATARLDQLLASLNTGPSSPTAFFGNEPAFAVPYTYLWAGTPWRTQDVVRRARTQLFAPTPAGLPGNDDLGATSAWFVWSAIGLYPVVPGTADLAVTSPLFPQVVVHSGHGATTTISAPALSATNYIGSMRVGGVATNRSWLPAATVLAGTTVDLTMTLFPGTAFGTADADRPPSYATATSAPASGGSTIDETVVGFTGPSGTSVQPPGTTRTVNVGFANTTASNRTVTFTATVVPVLAGPGAGLTATPAAATVAVPPSGRGFIGLSMAAAAVPAVYDVVIAPTVRPSPGAPGLPGAPLVVRVVVAERGDLAPFRDNTGTSDDANRPAANLDHTSFAYSRQALASVGITPGATVAAGGFTFTWPTATGGAPDNIVAAGQKLELAPVPGATSLGVLGSSTNAGGGASGTATITYTDGTTSTFTLGLTDWTRRAGTTPVAFGNQVVATAPYLNCQCGTSLPIATSIYLATAPVDPARTVASLTLPARVSSGDQHLFALALA